MIIRTRIRQLMTKGNFYKRIELERSTSTFYYTKWRYTSEKY
ncbi:protein of unknown function [Candidatus Nitrosotalea okcheonensis]|uniref:Uncharacterized protein n=1 Tax=Candidatus Nitrosotalea okcheonensis TaxID=1903276 RepID=A0A2H1FII3_9ARCH|nr:protein of unknown function [Candidatus Nitrosotalea okcheonensis]